MKKIILAFVCCFVVGISSVYATKLLATSINYKDTNVSDALDVLYSKTTNNIDLTSKTTLSNDGYELTSTIASLNEDSKYLIIRIKAKMVIDNRYESFTIDISDFNLSSITPITNYTVINNTNYSFSNHSYNTSIISFTIDTYHGGDYKQDIDAVIIYKISK